MADTRDIPCEIPRSGGKWQPHLVTSGNPSLGVSGNSLNLSYRLGPRSSLFDCGCDRIPNTTLLRKENVSCGGGGGLWRITPPAMASQEKYRISHNPFNFSYRPWPTELSSVRYPFVGSRKGSGGWHMNRSSRTSRT